MTDTTDVAAKGLDMIDKWAQQLGSALKQYGPDAVDLALALGRVGAARDVASGALLLIAAGGCAYLAKRLYPKAVTALEDMANPLPVFGLAIFALGAVAMAGASLTFLLNLYAWAGIFRPEIYLAAKALNL